MGDGEENGEFKYEESVNGRRNVKTGLNFNQSAIVTDPAVDEVKSVKKIKTSHANNVSEIRTLNNSLDSGTNTKLLDRSFIDLNSSLVRNLEAENSPTYFQAPSHSRASESQVNEIERVDSKVTMSKDCTVLLSEDRKRMSNSIASAILEMYNKKYNNKTLGNMTLTDILSLNSSSANISSGHSCINFKSSESNIDAKTTIQAVPSLFQNSGRLINTSNLLNNEISHSNENNVVQGEEGTQRDEYTSSFALSMYDNHYDYKKSGVNTFSNLYPYIGPIKKMPDASSPNLSSPMFKNLKVEETFDKRRPPQCLGVKRFEDSKCCALESGKPHDSLFGNEQQSLGNESISSILLNMEEQNHVSESLDGNTSSTAGSYAISEETTISNNVNTSETLEAETSRDSSFSSSSEEYDSSDIDESLPSPTSSVSSEIPDHPVSNDNSKNIVSNLISNNTIWNNSTESIFDVNQIRECVSYEPVCAKRQSSNFRSRYKNKGRPIRKKKSERNKKRLEVERKEGEYLKKQVNDLERLVRAYKCVAVKLLKRPQNE